MDAMRNGYRIVAACRAGVLIAALGCSMLAGPRLARAEDRADVQALVADLKGSDPKARRKALEALADMGPQARPAVQALIGVLDDPQELNRDYAITILKGIGPGASAALPALRHVARSDASQEI